MRRTDFSRPAIFLAVSSFLWVAIRGQECTRGWKLKKDDKPCARGYEEIYRDALPEYGPQYNRICCKPGTDMYKHYKGEVTSCKATECGASTSGDVCSTLPERWVNGSKLEYEETMRDACTRKNGKPGVTALCCVKDSNEGLLMTTLGSEPGEFPHMAKLYLPGNCGGTIYNKRWIVTAAHCIVDKHTGKRNPPNKMRAILGTNNADAEGPEFEYKVKRAIPHEQYSKLAEHPNFRSERKSTFNDIALLELDRDIKFGDKIKALEIAPKGFDPFAHGDKAVIVGWGTTDTLELSAHLQKANFVLRTDERCKRAWGHHIEGRELMKLCVGGVMDGKWSPTAGGGDSGGPAICRKKDAHPVLCGVTSYGGDDEKCAKHSDQKNCPPSVYAEVANYAGWIKKHACEQDPETLYKPYLYGKQVKRGQYEHQVHITSDSGKSCGGTLIAPDMVLTAQHCVMKANGQETHDNVQITTGNDLNGNGKTFEVAGAIPLEGFKIIGKPIDVAKQGNRVVRADNMFANDLVVVKLDGRTNVSPNKLPQLPRFRESFDEGVELSFPRNTSRGSMLMSRDFKILDHQDCQRRMNRMKKANLNIKVEKNIMCGVERYSGGSTCDRELGGGLLCQGDNGKEVLCGVQVFRLCELSIPNGFLNLAYYGDWIKQAMEAAKQF